MFTPVANLINLIIAHWEISVTVFAVFASLCLGVFKGAKHGIRALCVLLAIEVSVFCGLAIYYFIDKDTEGLVKFLIAWLPTILFLIIVVSSVITGFRRGLRKSLILMLHASVTAGLCLGLYFFCVTCPAVDKFVLDLINTFMDAGGLQNALGVSPECSTIREVLLAYVSDIVVDWGEFGILLNANGAYVTTLINMAYRIAFALVFFAVYQLLLFIMYIIYLVFYPERRYKSKKNSRFANNKAGCSYNKHPVGGGCVGLVRGLVSALVSISFVGSIFFVVAGGSGASRLPDNVSFGKDYDQYLSIYRSIEAYGDQGIFKILNAVSDPEDTPYYLYAADIVFSGGLDDEEHGVSGNIKLRDELAAYTGFAKNTLALLMKYDADGEIAAILNGQNEDNTEGKINKILNVCLNPEFKVEFDNLIDNFDSKTYVINFALSLADAVIANIDDMSFMSEVSADNKELLKVMFTRGYLSDIIPDEREIKHSISGEVNGEIPPHLTINHLFTKKDAQNVLDIVLSVIANKIDVKDPATVKDVLIPYISDLSILSSERSKEMDPVLGRLYCYFENKYLTEDGEDGIRYSEIRNEQVCWTREIRALLSVADGLYDMYGKISGSDNVFAAVTAMFDDTAAEYEDNVRNYEELTVVISDSALLSRVFCSQKIRNYLYGNLHKISENVYLPEKITYENKYDANGNLISHGEAYQVLRGLRLLGSKENKEIVDLLLNTDGSDEEDTFKSLITKLSETLTKDDPDAPGNSLASYLTESQLLRSVLSSVITDKAGDMLVVPVFSFDKDKNGEIVNVINKYELRQIFDALTPEVADLLIPLGSEDVTAEHINSILDNDTVNLLLDDGNGNSNKIVEATVAKALIGMLEGNEKFILPRKLEDYEEWITIGGTEGELRKLLYTVKALEIDIGEMIDGGGPDRKKIFDKINDDVDVDSIERLFESGVFHYTASKMLDEEDFGYDGFKVIVPSSSYSRLNGDSLERVIKKDELASVFIELGNFGLASGTAAADIVKKLVEKKDVLDRSDIISASVVNYIVSNADIRDALSIPRLYIDAGSEYILRNSFDAFNIWRGELPALVDAVDEIFGVSVMAEDEKFEFNGDEISEKTGNLLKSIDDESVSQPDRTKFDVCYGSEIIRCNIATRIDKALNGEDGSDQSLIYVSVRDSFKSGITYPQSEVSALIKAIEALGIEDIDGVSSADQFTSVSGYRDNIDVICNSGIVRGIITKQIDDGIEAKIDPNVQSKIKGGSCAYSKKEISALTDALDVLGLSDFTDIESRDFSGEISSFKGEKLDVIYKSDIINGVITKTVRDTFKDSEKLEDGEKLVYHHLANRSDLDVLRYEEIEALATLLNGVGNLDEFDIDTISLSEVRKQLWNGSLPPESFSAPNSYLISANITQSLINNGYFYVPSGVYNADKLINVDEQLRFIDSLTALQSKDSLSEWDVESENIEVPEKNVRETIMKSEIMRATFSHGVFVQNRGSDNILFRQSGVAIETRIAPASGSEEEKLVIISAEQLEALFTVVDTCMPAGVTKLAIPSLADVSEIITEEDNAEEIDALCGFDATRCILSGILIAANGCVGENTYCYKISAGMSEKISYGAVSVEMLTAEQIKAEIS